MHRNIYTQYYNSTVWLNTILHQDTTRVVLDHVLSGTPVSLLVRRYSQSVHAHLSAGYSLQTGEHCIFSNDVIYDGLVIPGWCVFRYAYI